MSEDPISASVIPRHLRRLKSNELVKRGDYIENDRQRFEMWDGPSGFRADSFVKTIYRKLAHQPVIADKIS